MNDAILKDINKVVVSLMVQLEEGKDSGHFCYHKTLKQLLSVWAITTSFCDISTGGEYLDDLVVEWGRFMENDDAYVFGQRARRMS